MKFAEHLGAHITPEWRKQYIHYEEMKSMLYSALEQAPSAEVVEEEVLQRYFARWNILVKNMFLGAIASLERAYGGQLVTINPLILL